MVPNTPRGSEQLSTQAAITSKAQKLIFLVIKLE